VPLRGDRYAENCDVADIPVDSQNVVMRTRTGNFAIGFRRGWSDWQKNDLGKLAQWAKANEFEGIDLGRLTAEDAATLKGNGLRLGTVDLLQFGEITHPDVGKRKDIIAANVAYVKEAGKWGARIFFTIVPGEADRSRAENYRLAVESFSPIAEAIAGVGGNLAIEGYPGAAPNYALLCTTPETCRAFLKDIPRGAALNFDPSHLIRLGVDPVRFLEEFLPHIVHVHAKDTEVMPEAVYEYGLYQPSAFGKGHGFGQHVWRYTIPGHGVARWGRMFQILKTGGYGGMVSVELEDENFNGTEEGEKAGLVWSLGFLRGA
jgi:sugar phosphate isomerase/epimerase